MPKIDEENLPFCRYLLPRTIPGLFRGFDGFDYGAIDHVFNWYQVPVESRPVLHDKFLIIIDAVQERRDGKSQSGTMKKCRHPSVCSMCVKRCKDRVTVQ